MPPKYNPKAIGERSEACFIAALLKAGKIVLTPFGDNQRYDLLIDEGSGLFLRVQCKTGRLKAGAIRFPTRSVAGGKTRRNYKGQIDAFGVYCPENDCSYLIPISHVDCNSSAALRVTPTANGQAKNIRWANDYLIA